MISDQPPSRHRLASSAVARPLVIGRRAVLPMLVCLCGWFALGAAGAQARPFIDGFSPTTLATTVPPNGDVNPYGIAPVFAQIDPHALPGPCPGGVGLTTALAVTRSVFVVVGSLPTSDGTAQTAKAGCLLVLNSNGKVVETIAGGPINGPWDMTAVDHGFFTTLYVTNVLNGTVAATKDFTQTGPVVNRGTVVRIQLLTIPGVRPVVF